jgi:hypothetical protein
MKPSPKKEQLQQPPLHDAIELNAAIWMVERIAETLGYRAIVMFEKFEQTLKQ